MTYSRIINAQQAWSLHQNERVVFVDVRYSSGEPRYGSAVYSHNHLPGAVFLDFKIELVGPQAEHGGRNPLPDVQELSKRLGELGIDRSTVIIIYEKDNGTIGPRFWWLLEYLGQERTYILDGGYDAWVKEGLPVTTDIPAYTASSYIAEPRADWLVDVEGVRQSIGRDGTHLLDSRPGSQYLGLEAPLDPIAGHIPGARNYYWKESLDSTGGWRTAERQRERFRRLPLEDEIIVYCGSGISATPNVLALREAGYTRVKLYPGSWSDWISYEENRVATGEE